MKHGSKIFRRGAIVAALAIAGSAGSAAAVQAPSMVNCQGSGTVGIANASSGFAWTLNLSGVSCSSQKETLGGTTTGSGTSDTLGLCPTPPQSASDSLTVNNLKLDVTENLSGALGSKSVTETWEAAQTSFPDATPFEIMRDGAVVGSGTISTHIYAHCPPEGTPSAFVTWSEQG